MSERQRILVVDDHEDNLDLLKRRLERRGYWVETASNGPDALERIAHEPFELVILDVMMPGMSGLEVLQAVRARRSSRELPVIMATAKSGSSDVIEALDKGANDYVVKPIDLDVLLARMRAHLRSASAPRSEPGLEIVGPGATLDRKYQLETVLGAGGFGTVYRALHLSLKKPVAVKVLHTHLMGSQRALRSFAQEGVSACRVQHPNAIAILDAGTTGNGVPYLAMELLDGPTLQQVIEKEGALRLARAASIVGPLCAALEAAHREGIVHRDIKPANVVLSRGARGEELVKVLDFGIAKLMSHEGSGPPTLDEIAGTPQYMAPERLLGQPCDWRADVYSVGVTAYVMLAASLPFTYRSDHVLAQALQQLGGVPRPLGEVRPDLPPDLASVVMSALHRDAGSRPRLDEIAAVVDHFAATWTEPDWPPPRRPPPEDADTSPTALRQRRAVAHTETHDDRPLDEASGTHTNGHTVGEAKGDD